MGPFRTDLFARLTSGGRSSDTILVNVRIPAFLGTLTVTAHYPRYLGLEDEPMPVAGDTLLLPAGTRSETVGDRDSGPAVGSLGFGPAASADLDSGRGAGSPADLPRSSSGEYRLDPDYRREVPRWRVTRSAFPSGSSPTALPGQTSRFPASIRWRRSVCGFRW